MTSIAVAEKVESYLDGYKAISEQSNTNGYYWLREVKQSAIDHFQKIGFPTLRDEDWRFTNLTPLIKSKYKLVNTPSTDHKKIDLSGIAISEINHSLLVFVDGLYTPELTSILKNDQGIEIKPISKALMENEDLVKKYLFQYSKYEGESFTAINTAFFQDGAFIYVPSKTNVEELIHILYISTDSEDSFIYNPRNLFVVEDNSQARIIEHYCSLKDTKYFSNIVSEVFIGENSSLDHYFIEAESSKAYNISSLDVHQQRNSNFTSLSILIGGSIVRKNIHPVLSGEGCDSNINGLYLSSDRQHIDNFMKVEHASPHCNSRQLYNGILTDKSKGVFHGRIIVHKDAHKTDAKQTNRNLLLSDSARVDTKPQLEIYTDDVKCTHGATIGQMDKDALFYMRSRGIEEKKARSIMLEAFANQTLDNIKVMAIRDYIERLVKQWFLKIGVLTVN